MILPISMTDLIMSQDKEERAGNELRVIPGKNIFMSILSPNSAMEIKRDSGHVPDPMLLDGCTPYPAKKLFV